jgi:very-short-patch-repair endonuclease
MTPRTRALVKTLRGNMTDAEKEIWRRVRNKQLGVKFRRQQPIGQYVVDFVCFEKKLILEIDGGEHFESFRDEKRDKWFQAQGYRVFRFWNNDVLKNGDGVIQAIIKEISPSPLSPRLKGGIRRGVVFHAEEPP